MQLNDATRIIDVIDQRIRKATQSESRVETTWGTVAAVDASARYADVYLYGNEAPYASEYFRLPDGLDVTVGDSVKVAIDVERGDRWVEEAHYLPTYRKMALDTGRGQVKLGDGSAAPAFGAAGQVIKVNPAGTALEYGTVSGAPVGAIFMWGTVSAPTGYLLCDGSSLLRADYPDLFAVIGTQFGSADATHFNLPNLVGRFPVGRNSGNTAFDVLGETGGAQTHTHAGHSNHVVTQPSAHPALAHSAHAGTAVDDHAAQTHSAHTGTAVSAHAAHAHETPFIDNGAQTLSTTQAVFGSGTSRTRDWTGSFSAASGSYPVALTQSVTVSAHTVTQPSAHSDHPILSHAVTQPSAHSDHASMSHSGAAVDAHSAHDSPSHLPPYIVLNFIIKV